MDAGRTEADLDADRALGAKLDATGWGLFFLWVGVAIVAGLSWGVVLFGTGILSLGVQVARRLGGLAVAGWSVVFGTCLSLAGLVQWLQLPEGTLHLPAWVVPGGFALLGIAILVSTWKRSE